MSENGYGKSAWYRGCEVCSTSGEDVDLDRIAFGNMSVSQVIDQHLSQPEIRMQRGAEILLFFFGVPLLCVFICCIALYALELFI